MATDPRTTSVQTWSLRQADQTTGLVDRTENAVWAAFALWLLSRWFSDDERDQAARQAAATVEQARQISGNLGVAYIRQVLGDITGRQVRPQPLLLPPARRGADMTQVYGRHVEAFRREFSTTGDAARAQQAARARLRQLVETDLRIARRDAELQSIGVDLDAAYDLGATTPDDVVVDLQPDASGPGLVDTTGEAVPILGYRRIVHPELSESGVCGLCLAASDRIYTLAELMPIHAPTCKCTVAPVTEDYDPGDANDVDLEAIYRAAGGTTDGRKLKQTRFQVNEHGEYGAVLTRKGDRFQKQGQAPKGDPIERARRELAALEPVLVDLEQRAAAGDDVEAPLTYQRNRVAKLRAITESAA